MGYGQGEIPVEWKSVRIVDETQILVFLTDATEDPEKFGVRPKHQKWLKDMIHLLLEHLK